MAAPIEKLCVTLVHASVKHKLEVTKSDTDSDNTDLIVLDILEAARKVTGVPIHAQKLICKGKSLKDPNQSLQAAGIKDGSKIMIIGKKTNPDEEANYTIISTEEKKAENLEKKQKELEKEVEGIENGFLQDDLIPEACDKLSKRLAVCNEEFMRIMEKLDSMSIPEDQRTIRSKKKALIHRMHDCMDRNDALKSRIEDRKAKIRR
ncbi:BAG family molecular chaperone regulator 1-like [Glandiceps talaboti]